MIRIASKLNRKETLMKRVGLASFLLFAFLAIYLPVCASGSTETSFTGESGGTVQVSSSFTVPDSFFSGYVLAIPADLNLSYNSGSKVFSCSDTFFAKGSIPSNKKLIVGVEPEGTWNSTSYNQTVVGNIRIDSKDARAINLNGVDLNLSYAECSADEVARGSSNPVTHSIAVSVPQGGISYKTTYSNNIKFYVGLKDS